MTSFLIHVKARLRLTIGDGPSAGMVVLAGLSSLVIWPWLEYRPEPAVPGVDEFVLFMALLMWPFMLGVISIGRTGGGRTAGTGPLASEHAVPALPIGFRTRVVADAATLLAAALLFRLPGFLLGESARPLIGTPEVAEDGVLFRGWLFRQTVLCAVLFLPVLIAWCTPSSSHVYYLVRPVLLGIPLFVLLVTGSLRHPLAPVAAGLGLSVVAVAVAPWEPRASRHRGVATAVRGARLHRPGLDPEMRLRRDRWLAPLRAAWPWLAVLGTLEITILLLERYAGTPIILRALVSGCSVGLLISFAILGPMGMQLLKPAYSPAGPGTCRTSYVGAWAHLPVRRLALVRGVYFHAIVGGASLVAMALLHIVLIRLLELEGGSSSLLLAPLIFSVPLMAAFALSVAVGDRLRTGIALVTLVAVIPVHMTAVIRLGKAGMEALEPGPGMAIDLALLAVLALAGGLPPLVHLWRGDDV